jgi:hypothetical protein
MASAGSTYKEQASLLKAEMKAELVVVAGSWVPAGTGTTTPTGVRGVGFTVAQSATGVFDVTLNTKYYECVSFVAAVQVGGETTDATVQTGDLTEATGSVFEVHRVRTMTGATPTNFSSDSQPRVSFIGVFRVS